MKGIPTKQDVLEAWALMFRWNGGEKRLKADFHLVKAWYPKLDGLGPQTPGMADTLAALRAKGESRSGWGYFLAIMLLVTRTRRDEGGYWRVAIGLMDAASQVTRASNPERKRDALQTWLMAYREEYPNLTTAEVYAAVIRMCDTWGSPFEGDEVGKVTFYPRDGGRPVKNVSPGALKKKIERAATTAG